MYIGRLIQFADVCTGAMWRFPPSPGVRTVGRRKEDPHHVSPEGAVRSRGGEAAYRAPDHRCKRSDQLSLLRCYVMSDIVRMLYSGL